MRPDPTLPCRAAQWAVPLALPLALMACTGEVPDAQVEIVEVVAECGDGTVSANEVCDDGNTLNGDGCNAVCTSTEVCGNGILDAGEGCEDGNTDDGDGCDASCQPEAAPACGDGVLDAGEACDDGNTAAGDGCNATCTSTEVCGNGILDVGEACEDGNTDADDGCDASCQPEADPACGDGILDLGEVCDDGNVADGDGCNAVCTSLEVCGNGILDVGEACEDGNTDVDDGCDASCQPEADPACGDGILDVGEACDDGNVADGDGCNAVCTSLEVCGNGILDVGEACEDGNTDADDGCDASCQPEADPACGDGILDVGEACDDGNVADGDGCNAVCTSTEVCGNGILDVGEACEDGNTDADDGCDPSCQVEAAPFCGDGVVSFDEQCDDGNAESGDGCSFFCTTEVCGNGILDVGEECDDANTADGDVCSALCELEIFCGDGAAVGPEACDEGLLNGQPGGVCSDTCDLWDVILDDRGDVDLAHSGDSGATPQALTVGHIDGDETLDVAVAYTSGGNHAEVELLVNRGDGRPDRNRRDGVGDGPRILVESDLDSDGDLDLVSLNADGPDESISVWWMEDGVLGEPVTTNTNFFHGDLFDLAVGDIDNDGMQEIITIDATVGLQLHDIWVVDPSGSVSLDGIGMTLDLEAGSPTYGVVGAAFAEVTGDGLTDLLFADRTLDALVICPHLGISGTDDAYDEASCLVHGVFDSATGWGEDPFDLSVVDVDGDGNLDAVLTPRAGINRLVVVRLDGAGGVLSTAYVERPGCNKSSQGVLVDLNGDGAQDLVGSCQNSDSVVVHLATPGAAPYFEVGVDVALDGSGVGDRPIGLRAGDFNEDGHQDLVVAGFSGKGLTVLLGNGTGSLMEHQKISMRDEPLTTEIADVPVMDVNGDGHLDLVVPNRNASHVDFLLGRGDGSFYVSDTVEAGFESPDVALADSNGDGRIDVVTVSPADEVIVWERTEDGRTVEVDYGSAAGALSFSTGPLNGLAGTDPVGMVVLRNAGADMQAQDLFNSSSVWDILDFSFVDPAGDLVTADVDGDGWLDAVTSHPLSSSVQVHWGAPGGGLTIVDLVDVSTVTLSDVAPFDPVSGVGPVAVAVGDVTGDGLVDLVTVQSDTDDVVVLPALTSRTFGAPMAVVVTDVPGVELTDVAVGDLNGDSLQDVVVSVTSEDEVSVLRGIGGGDFAAPLAYAVGAGPAQVEVEDFDDDGVQDILTRNVDGKSLSLLYGASEQ